MNLSLLVCTGNYRCFCWSCPTVSDVGRKGWFDSKTRPSYRKFKPPDLLVCPKPKKDWSLQYFARFCYNLAKNILKCFMNVIIFVIAVLIYCWKADTIVISVSIWWRHDINLYILLPYISNIIAKVSLHCSYECFRVWLFRMTQNPFWSERKTAEPICGTSWKH